MSLSPFAVQEGTQGASDAGTKPHILENSQHLLVSNGVSIQCQSCANSESAEADMANQPPEMGPTLQPLETETAATSRKSSGASIPSLASDVGASVCSLDTLSQPTSRENTAGNVRQDAVGGFTKAPNNNLEHTDQADFTHMNVDHRLDMDPAELHEAHESSQPGDNHFDPLMQSIATFLHNNSEFVIPPQDSPVQSCTRLSDNAAEVTILPKENVQSLEGFFSCEDEFFGPQTSLGANETFLANEEKVADFTKQGVSNQETDAAVVVSTELNGWERFDLEESAAEGVFGCDHARGRKSQQNRELWEQLLEEGSEDNETHFPPSTSQFEAEASIDASAHEGNQFWLASPGNPFIEGLDRLSNFSEADGFGATENVASSQLLHDFEAEVDGFIAHGNIARTQLLPTFEVDMCLPAKEGPFHTDSSNENFSQGQSVEKHWANESNVPCDEGSRHKVRPRFPSFSDIRRRASKSREPSFGSFLEQVPSFQADSSVHGVENGGENWVANFDSMVPATTEGPRSLSLPRETGNKQGQRQKQTCSLFSQETPATSQSKSLGFSSAKLSPIVKKAVKKVGRSKPEQVVKAVHCGENSNTMDKEQQPKGWMWRCCICCARTRTGSLVKIEHD